MKDKPMALHSSRTKSGLVYYHSLDGRLRKLRPHDQAVAYDVDDLRTRFGKPSSAAAAAAAAARAGDGRGGGGDEEDEEEDSTAAKEGEEELVLHETASVGALSTQAMAAAVSGGGLDGGESYHVDAATGFTAEQLKVQRGLMSEEDARAAAAAEVAWATNDALQQLRTEDGDLYWWVVISNSEIK